MHLAPNIAAPARKAVMNDFLRNSTAQPGKKPVNSTPANLPIITTRNHPPAMNTHRTLLTAAALLVSQAASAADKAVAVVRDRINEVGRMDVSFDCEEGNAAAGPRFSLEAQAEGRPGTSSIRSRFDSFCGQGRTRRQRASPIRSSTATRSLSGVRP